MLKQILTRPRRRQTRAPRGLQPQPRLRWYR